jgi:hypothetical protein
MDQLLIDLVRSLGEGIIRTQSISGAQHVSLEGKPSTQTHADLYLRGTDISASNSCIDHGQFPPLSSVCCCGQ